LLPFNLFVFLLTQTNPSLFRALGELERCFRFFGLFFLLAASVAHAKAAAFVAVIPTASGAAG
jgi:hypothetical protein